MKLNLKKKKKKEGRCNNSQCLTCAQAVINSVVGENIKNEKLCFSAGHKSADKRGGKNAPVLTICH